MNYLKTFSCKCGYPLLMFGCSNPRCDNYTGNKKKFYHERIKTQEEIDEYWKKKETKNNPTENNKQI